MHNVSLFILLLISALPGAAVAAGPGAMGLGPALRWQFENRDVPGVRCGRRDRLERAYQRMHHSNLNLAGSNQGVDSHLLPGYHF